MIGIFRNRYKYLVPKDFDPNEYLRINTDVAALNIDPHKHYIENGRDEGRAYKQINNIYGGWAGGEFENKLKDYIEYLKTKNILFSDIDRMAFDASWYSSEYPEIAATGLSPIDHFAHIGKAEGRHPRFDAEWYLAEYEDVAKSNIGPLDHYLRYGKQECRHPAFNASWYLDEYADVKQANVDAAAHYRSVGKQEGRAPAFNKYWYIDGHHDICAAGVDPYYHYQMLGRREGRHPAFSAGWYLKEYPDVLHSGLRAYEHYKKYAAQVNYRPGPTPEDLARNSPRLTNFPPSYDAEYQPEEIIANRKNDIKALAFYLPQFHESAENNLWWGNGFTEWSNTRTSKPKFEGHYQPRTPHKDVGYYDLSDVNVMARQIDLARRHGIYGFCFYYYWFSGKRLLSKPVDLLLENSDIDIPFCLCWANENWTRRWDGQEDDILIQQNYTAADPTKFITDIAKYLEDPRYIRINDAPVIIVYKPHLIPNVGDVFAAWRYEWKVRSKQDLIIWCNRTESADYSFEELDAEFDAVVEFPPHMVPHEKHVSKYKIPQNLIGINDAGNYYDYRRVVDDIVHGTDYCKPPAKPFYRGVTLGWDNSARRASGQSIWYGFSLEYYHKWLTHVIHYTRRAFPEDQRFVFINAWNEWAEGTYLEPDEATGYANINVTSRALFGLPLHEVSSVSESSQDFASILGKKIAIHVHVYFVELIDYFVGQLKSVETPFDLYVTTDTEWKKEIMLEKVDGVWPRQNVKVIVSKNLGRDIGPMLIDVSKDLLKYDYIAHLHTKKSTTVPWGHRWCEFLVENLLGSSSNVSSIIGMLDGNPQLGIVYPPTYPLMARHISWGNVKDRCSKILASFGYPILLPEMPDFPVGNMFWAKVSAIAPILEWQWREEDFEQEEGQISETLPHCIERLWTYVAKARGYWGRQLISGISPDYLVAKSHNGTAVSRLAILVHYDVNNTVSDADMHLLRSLKDVATKIVVVSNSAISDNDAAKIGMYADDIFVRNNSGFDFGAWRDALSRTGWDNIARFNELILVNNSCYGPVVPLQAMFDRMMQSAADFWGVTSFPEQDNSPRPEAVHLSGRKISAHLQSYFLVFKQSVVTSGAFYRFWSKVADKNGFMDVVTSYEVGLTDYLSKAGFTWEAYIPEAAIMQDEMKYDPRFNFPYNLPYDLLLLQSPFVKKRAWDYSYEDTIRSRHLVDRLKYMPHHYIWR
jgi:lipopolysaccharide biosynthesis protein